MLREYRKPNLFIVGAPKSATTAMNLYLGKHPDIYMGPKEIHYFGKDLQFRHYKRPSTILHYLEKFSDANNERIVGETSVWYLYSKFAANEIHNFSPLSKVIIMLRNPVDVVYSNFYQFLYNENENVKDFATAIRIEIDRKYGRSIPKSAMFPDGLLYKKSVKYYEQVLRYLKVFGQKNVHIIIFDDLLSDFSSAYKETLKFLEVPEYIMGNFQTINANKTIRNRFIRKVYSNPPFLLRMLFFFLIPSNGLRGRLRKRLKEWNTIYKTRKPMDSKTRLDLQKAFALDVKNLGHLIDRDLTHWLKE